MREMKNSGIPWIGEIPSHWKTVQAKFYCKSVFAGGTPDSNNLEYWDGNIPWLPSGACHDIEVTEANKYITQLGYENSSTKYIPANTTIMAMTGATCANTGFVKFDTCANQSVVAYVQGSNSVSKFLFYTLQAARQYILTYQTGGAQAGINVQNCKNFIVPCLSLPEQQAIADFLDKKCAEIDEMVTLQEKIIEELKAYKQSVITEAVTKGLNPDAPMKDSGVEWIGEIPKTWCIYRIKYNTFLKGRIGWQGLNSNDFIDEGFCLITGTDFDNKGGINWNTCYRISKERFDEDELLHIKNGDLLMTKDGTVGKMAYIDNLPEEASLNSHLLIIRQLTNRVYNSFLYWAMLSEEFKGFCSIYQSGSIMNSVSQSTLGDFSCACPSLEEQLIIVDYLSNKCSEIDSLISLKQSKIEQLKEYKKSVIYEYVTGKKEVEA